MYNVCLICMHHFCVFNALVNHKSYVSRYQLEINLNTRWCIPLQWNIDAQPSPENAANALPVTRHTLHTRRIEENKRSTAHRRTFYNDNAGVFIALHLGARAQPQPQPHNARASDSSGQFTKGCVLCAGDHKASLFDRAVFDKQYGKQLETGPVFNITTRTTLTRSEDTSSTQPERGMYSGSGRIVSDAT